MVSAPTKDLQPGEKPLTLSNNNPAFLLLNGEMDLLLLARTTTKILVLRELLGMMELMDLHHLRELKDMVNGTVAVEKTSLMAAKLEKIS